MDPVEFNKEEAAVPTPIMFGFGMGHYVVRPVDGDFLIQGQQTNKPANKVSLHFAKPEDLPNLLGLPANEAFMQLVVGVLTPASVKAIREFAILVEQRLRNAGLLKGTMIQPEMLHEAAAATAIAPERYYFVSLDNGERSVNPALGELLREGAEDIGRLTGTAEKEPGKRHSIRVLTGQQVIDLAIPLR
jgi:hypothetical protein